MRTHISHWLKTCVLNLQRGTIRRWWWHSWKVHRHVEEMDQMVTATVRLGEHRQTMGRQAATVVFSEMIASVIAIAIAIASWWETAAAE